VALLLCAQGVANLKCDETPQIARYFLLGVDVGSEPIFNGICSMCATLLHGNRNDQSAGTNWKAGPPMDRHGQLLVTPEGRPDTSTAPPCFLRFSPRLFATEAPDMFDWDEGSNKLKLKPGREEPWIMHNPAPSESAATWRYCISCHDRWAAKAKAQRAFVTYRDKASQSNLRPSWHEVRRQQKRKAEEMESSQSQTQEQPAQADQPQAQGADASEGALPELLEHNPLFEHEKQSSDGEVDDRPVDLPF